MTRENVIARLRAALPDVREWIARTVSEHLPDATQVSRLGFERLPDHLPLSLLERTRVVTVRRVPFPPLVEFGLHELGEMERRLFDGITFKDTIFARDSCLTESLVFHELVHVLQWDRLGVVDFLMAYGIGLMQFGYEESPLEKIAYRLQGEFERATLPANVVATVDRQTDRIWAQVEPLLHE